jgi:H+/gluconate symporter-like permease
LFLAGIVTGSVGGLNESTVVQTLMSGFGKTLGSIGNHYCDDYRMVVYLKS